MTEPEAITKLIIVIILTIYLGYEAYQKYKPSKYDGLCGYSRRKYK